MFASFAAAKQFFGQGPLLAFIRVLGSSVARIAEAAVSLFLANVEAPIVERGASELALAQANLRAVQLHDTIPNAMADDPVGPTLASSPRSGGARRAGPARVLPLCPGACGS